MARIELRKRGAIGEIRLNRPEVLNAQGREWPAEVVLAADEHQAARRAWRERKAARSRGAKS